MENAKSIGAPGNFAIVPGASKVLEAPRTAGEDPDADIADERAAECPECPEGESPYDDDDYR